MSQGAHQLDELVALFDNSEVEELVIDNRGVVHLIGPNERQHLDTALTADSLNYLVESLLSQSQEEALVHEVTTGGVLWTVLLPPLVETMKVSARRFGRPPAALGDFIDATLLNSEQAKRLSSVVMRRENLLVVSPSRANGLRLLNALMSFAPRGQQAFFVGRGENAPYPTELTVIDHRQLRRLDSYELDAVDDLLERAQWVYTDKLGSPEDLATWFGKNCFAHGRIGFLQAETSTQGKAAFEKLYQAAFNFSNESKEVSIDWLVMVNHLKIGQPDAIDIQKYNERQSASKDAPVVSTERSSLTPVPKAVAAQEPPIQQREPKPSAKELYRPSSGPQRPSSATQRPLSAAFKPARKRKPEPSTPASGVRPPPQANTSADQTLRVSSSVGNPQVNASVNPKRPSSLGVKRPNSILGRGNELFSENIEADFSLDDGLEENLNSAVSSAFDDFSDLDLDGGLFSPEEEAELDSFGSSKASTEFEKDDEPKPAPSEPRTTRSPSRYNAETVRHDAERIRAERNSRYQVPVVKAQQAPPADPPRRSASGWRAKVGRGAATPARGPAHQAFGQSDPPTTDQASLDQPGYNAFMQEGTLDDVDGDTFADEPTRRAEWPNKKNLLSDVKRRGKGSNR